MAALLFRIAMQFMFEIREFLDRQEEGHLVSFSCDRIFVHDDIGVLEDSSSSIVLLDNPCRISSRGHGGRAAAARAGAEV